MSHIPRCTPKHTVMCLCRQLARMEGINGCTIRINKVAMFLIAIPLGHLRRDVQSPPRMLHQGSCPEGQLVQRYRDHSVCQEESRLGSEVDRGNR